MAEPHFKCSVATCVGHRRHQLTPLQKSPLGLCCSKDLEASNIMSARCPTFPEWPGAVQEAQLKIEREVRSSVGLPVARGWVMPLGTTSRFGTWLLEREGMVWFRLKLKSKLLCDKCVPGPMLVALTFVTLFLSLGCGHLPAFYRWENRGSEASSTRKRPHSGMAQIGNSCFWTSVFLWL